MPTLTSSTVSLSMNEAKFFFTRAAVGAGVPFGLGEDFAAASIWLAGQGIDPAKISAPALSALAEGRSSRRITRGKNASATHFVDADGQTISALFAGPAVADWMQVASAIRKEIIATIVCVDQPALIAAYMAIEGFEAGLVEITWPGRKGKSFNVEIGPNSVNGLIASVQDNKPPSPAKVTVVFKPHNPISEDIWLQADPRIEVVDVAAEPWKVVMEFFKKCLVPSSEHSLEQGAGAGLKDKD